MKWCYVMGGVGSERLDEAQAEQAVSDEWMRSNTDSYHQLTILPIALLLTDGGQYSYTYSVCTAFAHCR